MRKIYVLASAVVFASGLVAQKPLNTKRDAIPSKAEHTTNKTTSTNITKKAPGDVFWYENFANGLNGNAVDGGGTPIGGTINWTKGYLGANDYSTVWVYDTSGPQGQYEDGTPFKSESAANGWMLFDANLTTDNDPNTDADGFLQMDGWIESPEINIGAFGTSALGLEYQQSYRTCCSGSAYPVNVFVGYYDGVSGAYTYSEKNTGNFSHNEYPADVDDTGYSPETRTLNLACEANLAAVAGRLDNANLALTNGGSGYSDGTYAGVALTGGTGTGAAATITISGGVVTAVQLTAAGTGYTASDALSADDANLGGNGGSGLIITATGLSPQTIKIRFHWNADQILSNSYYFWMIDDVRIKEIGGVDGDLFSMYSGDIVNDFEYYAIPDGQISAYPLVVIGEMANKGGTDLTGVGYDVVVTEDASSTIRHSSTSTTVNISTCDGEDYITYNTGYIPTNNGVYTVDLTIKMNETDGNAANDTQSRKFEKTEFEFGHYNPYSADLGIVAVNRTAGSTTRSGKQMSYYGIYEDATVYGMYVYFVDGSTTVNTTGQIAKITLYDPADGVTVLTSQDFVLYPNYIGQVVPIKFSTPLVSSIGDSFYASIDGAGGGDMIVIAADYDGDADNSTLLDQNGNLYGASYDPYVNISFDPAIQTLLSTDEIANEFVSVTAVPNPAANNTEVRFSTVNTANVSIEVVDVTGKVVLSQNLGNKVAGNHTFELNTSNLSDGIYYYTLTSGQDRLTNKLVVRK